MSDDLVKRAARNICCMNGQCYRPEKCFSWAFSGEARAAIAVALEEAAKMLEARWAYGTADHQAAAIRALMKKPTDPGPASGSGF